MKKLLFVLILIPLISFGQDLREGTQDINYSGKSTYTVHKESTGPVSLKRLYKRGIKTIEEWTNSLNANYKVINVDNVKAGMGITPKVTITFKLLRKDGSEWLTKEDAITKFKELKELLEIGVINQEEFDKKAEELRKIILDN